MTDPDLLNDESAGPDETPSELPKAEDDGDNGLDSQAEPLDGWHLVESDGDVESDSDGDWPAEDLESAYRMALEANNAVEWHFAHLTDESASDGEASEAGLSPDDGDEPAERQNADEATADADDSSAMSNLLPERVTARQVIEAAIFVGGEPITTKRLCFMLRGDYDLDYIEDTIEDLNHQYEREARPYEIRLGEGGYRLVLHEEFQRVRNRVFGIGPREVKLSQDVLEVLALVAYRQPITQSEIEALGRPAAGPLLRQLLRRELISIQRDGTDRKKVEYSTTRRFLSVFGLGSIDELPQADELAFK